MKKLCIILFLLTVSLTAVSCMKEFERKHTGPDSTGIIPTNFAWSTVHDVTAMVNMPTVDGIAPEFAIVRIYSSPTIAANREIALGVLTPASPSFQTAFTIPDGVTTVYVKTTLPDGRSSVYSADVSNGRLDIPGAQMAGAPPARELFAAEESSAQKSTSMPQYPTLPEKELSDFDSRAVISDTPKSDYQLGTNWGEVFPTAEYYIPTGAEINGKIDLNGYSGSYPNPILYVKGKLTLSSPQVGGTIAVLPGGEVIITGTLAAREIKDAPHPAIYVFKGGKLTADNANLSCKSIVNNGTLHIEDRLDGNNHISIYNGTDGNLSADEFYLSNNCVLYNDGKINAEDFLQSSRTTFENCENGVVVIDKMSLMNGNSTFFTQKGKATINEMACQGVFNVYCYTRVGELETEGAKINIATDACLDTQESELNNTHTSMAGGSLFIAKEYNLSSKGGNNCNNDSANTAVFRIEEKAVISKKVQTQFSGSIEVVYDNSKVESEYQIDDNYVKTSFKGAYLTDNQTVNIPASECNGGKGVVTPEPETKPGDIEIAGETYTYCFEDGWPWLCDYDMNDVVVPINIDRQMSNDGSKVESIRINWEVKASGAKHRLAMAVQLDKVKTNQIASVETTNNQFGTGPFAGPGCEAGNDNAVIPFFNSINETQAAGETFFNTEKDRPTVETTKHTTTIHFTSPIDVGSVLESTMNIFIVVNRGTTGDINRDIEVHLPAFKPTKFGEISNINSIQPGMPYKFYSQTNSEDSGMMWGLMIPGKFRYPAESRDIRNVYTYFKSWAISGGSVHKEWYLEDVNKVLLY